MNKLRSKRSLWTKIVKCPNCGNERSVRKDSTSTVCKACNGSKAGTAASLVIKAKVVKIPCKTCGHEIPKRLGHTYCSVKCRTEDKKIERICKCCGKTFSAYKSAINGKTNASGNFCSRECYEKWMCNGERVTGRGSQWNKIRRMVLDTHPFCAMCSESVDLQVHHIAPFRLTHDNSEENLIPLCKKHHKIVESITHDVEFSGSSSEDMKFILGNILSELSSVSKYMARKNANTRNMAD